MALTSAIDTAIAAPTSVTAQKTSITGDFNTFLTLLTTQLKNQDPTKALDTNELTNQLVSFAGVEQQINANKSLETLIGLQQAAQLTASAPLIGQQVEVTSERLTLQDGAATLRLPPAGAARDAVVRVQDSLGRTIREQTVSLGAAPKDWVWDGRNAAGQQQPDGTFAFTVAGRDAQGQSQPVTATVVGRATAAERVTDGTGKGQLQLSLGALAVGFDAVRSLSRR